MSVNDVGSPGQPLNDPSLTDWQASVRDALDGSDVSVDARDTAAINAHKAAANPHTQYVRGTGLKVYPFQANLGAGIVAGSTSVEGSADLTPAGFTAAPFVVVTPATPFNTVTWAVSTRGATATSVIIRAQGAASPGSSSFTISGIAIGT